MDAVTLGGDFELVEVRIGFELIDERLCGCRELFGVIGVPPEVIDGSGAGTLTEANGAIPIDGGISL